MNRMGWELPEHKVFEFFPKRTKYCIGIPVLNEGERIKKQLKKMKNYSKLADILIFDSRSTDGSTNLAFLKSVGIRALLDDIDKDKGQSTKLRMGFAYAMRQNYKGIITLDGNGKDDVSAIPRFIKALDGGFDYTQGSRFIKGGRHKNTPIDRMFFNRFVISPLLSLAAGRWYTDTPNAFRAYSSRYLLHPKVNPFRNIFTRYELLFYLATRANQLGLKTKEVPVTRSYPEGELPTKIVGWKKVIDMLNVFRIAFGFFNP